MFFGLGRREYKEVSFLDGINNAIKNSSDELFTIFEHENVYSAMSCAIENSSYCIEILMAEVPVFNNLKYIANKLKDCGGEIRILTYRKESEWLHKLSAECSNIKYGHCKNESHVHQNYFIVDNKMFFRSEDTIFPEVINGEMVYNYSDGKNIMKGYYIACFNNVTKSLDFKETFNKVWERVYKDKEKATSEITIDTEEIFCKNRLSLINDAVNILRNNLPDNLDEYVLKIKLEKK